MHTIEPTAYSVYFRDYTGTHLWATYDSYTEARAVAKRISSGLPSFGLMGQESGTAPFYVI